MKNCIEIFGCTGEEIYGQPQVAVRFQDGFRPGPFGGEITRFGALSLATGEHTGDVKNSLPEPKLTWQLAHYPPGRAFKISTMRVSPDQNGLKLRLTAEPPENEVLQGVFASPATVTAEIVGDHPEVHIPKVIFELS
jgi:hypothetical protein